MDITPNLANLFLKKNVRNRPLREALVERYANAMRNSEWKFTSEPIMFCDNYVDPDTQKRQGETLMEGQHRLTAIARSGCTVKMTVIYGCDADEFNVIGQGRKRTTAEVLGLIHKDLQHPNHVATICSAFIYRGLSYNVGIETWLVRRVLHHIGPEIGALVKYKMKLGRMMGREFGVALTYAQLIKPGITAQLVEKLYQGLGFEKEDPARLLWRYINNDLVARIKRDSPETMLYTTCNGVMKVLLKEETDRLKQDTTGFAWLRNAAKDRLEPLLQEVHGERRPENFYTPKIGGNHVRQLAKLGLMQGKTRAIK